LRSGTEAVPLAYSFGIALTEAQEIKEKECERLREIRDFCKTELVKVIDGITFYGVWEEKQEGGSRKHDEMKRLPNNINCRVPGISSEEMIIRLDAKGFAVSHKSACSSQVEDGSYVIRALGASENESKENIRITLGRSTTKSDIEKLVKSIKEIRGAYAK
jgi:cysteine desulfurase